MDEETLHKHLKSRFPRENDACEHKEFKNLKHAVTGKKGEDIVSYLSAIANVAGGHIVLGVKDKTLEIVGIRDFDTYTRENIIPRIVGFCTHLNSEGFQVESHVTTDTLRHVWVIHVPKHMPRLPVYAHGKAWQRSSDSLIELRPERLAAILNEPIELTDWSAQVVAQAGLADLDLEALETAREKFKERNVRKAWYGEIDSWDWPTFLDKARLTVDGKMTRACLLLLGKPGSSHYLSPHPAQITYKLDADDKDYEHFAPPFILATTALLRRIRNVPQKLFPSNQLLPVEIQKYETRSILEGMHNCIAHQDYERQERILVTEKPDRLIFESPGSFFDGSAEEYFKGTRTARRYRNTWLAHAMTEVNMIDTAGYGIHEMTKSQRTRYLPLPDYRRSSGASVVLEVLGRPIDEKYSQLLLERHDLDIDTVILLDRVQKGLPIADLAATRLRREKLIEGKKPKLRVAHTLAVVAPTTTKHPAATTEELEKALLSFLAQSGSTRDQINALIIPKLPSDLTDKQKLDRVKNLLSAMRRNDLIVPDREGRGAIWQVVKQSSKRLSG